MKKGNPVASLFYGVLFAIVFAFMFSQFLGEKLLLPIAAIILAFSFYAGYKNYNRGAVRDGVYVEIWTGELVKRFKLNRAWLAKIPSYNHLVKNKVIHLVDVGADPTVYLNLNIDANNPVPTSEREDDDIPIMLDRMDTENTRIFLHTLRAISYDKMATTIELHMNALEDAWAVRAAWRLAATQQSNIKTTSGNSDGRPVAKKRITPDDFVMMSELVSSPYAEGGPQWQEGVGIAVLDHRHVADLQKLDQHFDKQWRDAKTGELFPYNGWNIQKFSRNGSYKKDGSGDFLLNAYGAAYDPANDLHSSLFFNPDRAFSAADSGVEMFYEIATTNPALRASTIGFRQWGTVAKKKADGFYSLVSDKV